MLAAFSRHLFYKHSPRRLQAAAYRCLSWFVF
nr:MAG TPA: hypothetical protein [Caudoviricetes sp.]